MFQAIFESFLLVIFLILMCVGLPLLISGIVKHRKGMWITGTIFSALGLLFAVWLGYAHFSSKNDKDQLDYEYEHAMDYAETDPEPYLQETSPSDPSSKTDSLRAIYYSKPKRGIFWNKSKQSKSFDIYVHKNTSSKGIQISSVQCHEKENNTVFSVELRFSSAYKGKMMLEIFTYDDHMITSMAKSIEASGKSNKTADYYFGHNISFSTMRYCTINVFE